MLLDCQVLKFPFLSFLEVAFSWPRLQQAKSYTSEAKTIYKARVKKEKPVIIYQSPCFY